MEVSMHLNRWEIDVIRKLLAERCIILGAKKKEQSLKTIKSIQERFEKAIRCAILLEGNKITNNCIHKHKNKLGDWCDAYNTSIAHLKRHCSTTCEKLEVMNENGRSEESVAEISEK